MARNVFYIEIQSEAPSCVNADDQYEGNSDEGSETEDHHETNPSELHKPHLKKTGRCG